MSARSILTNFQKKLIPNVQTRGISSFQNPAPGFPSLTGTWFVKKSGFEICNIFFYHDVDFITCNFELGTYKPTLR